ncbi:MAG: AI-2E family transporter, partial [Nannocystaceae bacterium]
MRKLSRLWGFAAFLLFTIVLFRQVVVPFIFAFALAYILQPLIKRMEGTIGRVSSVIVVYVGVLGAIAAFIMIFLPALIDDFTRLRDAAPRMIEYADQELLPRATEWLSESFGSLESSAGDVGEAAVEPAQAAQAAQAAQVGPSSQVIARPLSDGSWQLDLDGVHLHAQQAGNGHWTVIAPEAAASQDPSGLEDTLRKLVQSKGTEYTGMIYEVLRSLISGVTSFLTKFVITLMLAAFILIDPQRIWRFVRSLIPQIYRSDFDKIAVEMDTGLSGVIRGQLLICLVNGVLTYIGLVIIGIKYSFLLALIAGGFSLIPIFGTIISSIPIMVIGLVSTDDGT